MSKHFGTAHSVPSSTPRKLERKYCPVSPNSPFVDRKASLIMHCALCFSYAKMGHGKLLATHNPAEWPFAVHTDGTLDATATLAQTKAALGCDEAPETLKTIDEAAGTVESF